SLSPTIMSLEYGANEILGYAADPLRPGGGGTNPPDTTGVMYARLMTQALDAIHTALPNTRVAVFNVPDVTTIPFFTTLSPVTLNAPTGAPMPLVGANGLPQPGDLILLAAGQAIAAGTGIPTGGVNYLNPAAGSNGQPLPEVLILRKAEVDATQAQE